MNFNDILNKGTRRHKVKNQQSVWDLCEYCDERRELFEYKDSKDCMWMLCNECCDTFIEDESKV